MHGELRKRSQRELQCQALTLTGENFKMVSSLVKVRDPKENIRKLVLQRWTLKQNSYVVLTGMTLTVLDSKAFTAPLFGHDHKPPLGSIIGK